MIEFGKIYRHYKGGLYKPLFIARHSENEDELVIYQNVENPELIWARPVEMWNDIVDKKGTLRFKLIEADEK